MITVDSLVLIPDLNIGYLAGSSGGGRPVSWAHAVDLPDPWEWVGAGDLVMTTGAGIPEDDLAQAEWLVRLIEAGVSGLIVASPPGGRKISPVMLHKADMRSFPLLKAPYELEFVSLARLVIKNSLTLERQQLDKAKRLFDAYGQSISQDSGVEQRLGAIARSLGWQLELIDDVDGQTIVSSQFKVHSLTESSVAEVPGRLRTRLRIQKPANSVPDTLLTYYVGAIMALELEQQAKALDELRLQGSVALTELLEGVIDFHALAPLLRRRGLNGKMVLACMEPGPEGLYKPSNIHLARLLRDTGILITEEAGRLIALVPEESDIAAGMVRLLGKGTKAGVSACLSAVVDAQEAKRQASLALHNSSGLEAGVFKYSDPAEAGYFPRSVAESRAVVDRILGRLIEHDRTSSSSLLNTLEVFLNSDRSLLRASQQLNIHRQTLVYRLKTIQQITGLHPASTEGTAQFWFALQTAHRSSLL